MKTTQEIWQLYSKEIKQFIVSKVRNNFLADDILQEVFLKIHTNLHTLKDTEKLKPWLFVIARNSVLDYFKTSKKVVEFKELELESKREEVTHTEADCLKGILANLPRKYRIPLFLSDIKGVKQQEIAEQLNLPLATVKSQIQRARKQIAQGFMDCCGFIMNEDGKLVGEIQEKENCKVCS